MSLSDSRMRIRSKIWLEKDGRPVFGIGKLKLLREVEREGSISKAAKKLNISFRRAWSHLDSAEKNFGIRFLEKRKGGKGGGSSTLTQEAKILLKKFERLTGEIMDFTEHRFEELFSDDLQQGKKK